MKRLPFGVGHVYVIGVGENRVKIGKSFRPWQRIQTLSRQGGAIITSYFITPLHEGYSDTEKLAHRALAQWRGFGEWFSLPFGEAEKTVRILFEIKGEVTQERIAELLAYEEVENKARQTSARDWSSTCTVSASMTTTKGEAPGGNQGLRTKSQRRNFYE